MRRSDRVNMSSMSFRKDFDVARSTMREGKSRVMATMVVTGYKVGIENGDAARL